MTTNPAIITFDVALFRKQFPAYANPAQFSDDTLQSFWNAAICYMSDVGNFGSLQGTCRQYGLNLLTAHLLYISQLINRSPTGQVPYVLSASTIDKVQITQVPVPIKTQWGWWLQISGYGQQLAALLQSNSVGGFYIGGSPILTSFRGYGLNRGIPIPVC